MTKDDEVVPDSQDEAELHVSEPERERDLSPPPELPSLTNATIPSVQASSSFVLPRPMSTKKPTPLHPASSSISQFTTSTEITAEPTGVSAISAFTTTSSSGSRPRPKPRPAYAAAKATSTSKSAITSPAVSTISNAPYALPPPQATFSSDISERIKARRGGHTVSTPPLAQEPVLVGTGPKKATCAEVIDITSDDDIAPRHARSSSSRHSPKSRSPDPLNLSAATRSVASELVISLSALKRKRDSVNLPTKLGLVPEGPRSLTVCFPASDSVFEAPPSKKTKKRSKAAEADTGTGLPKPKKVKAKARAPKATGQETKKAPPKPKANAQEKEQFKSREFIEDSDDELGLGDRDSAGRMENMKPHIDPPESATKVAISSHKTNSPESLPEQETPTEVNTEKPTNEASRKKSNNKKRKKAGDTQDEQSANIETFQPPPKKMKPVETITEKKLSSPSKQNSHTGDRITETKSASPKDPVEEIPRTPEDHVDVSYSKKKKKGSRKIIEDDEEQSDHEEAKENEPPVAKTVNISVLASTMKSPESPFPSKPPSSISKPSYAHPPKNRPLSSILQRVNGSSPRLRASPSVSRSLLTRIAPLHPNRRTPPPPPPPRIIPKKTKKELEREEKWEEELQETEGWCEMEEEERNKLRRAKRDWELGLCEE